MLAMKTCDEIRYENLKRLVEDAGGLSRLVEKSNGKLNRPTLYQILEKITTAAGTVKNVGDDLARKIEDSLKLERGWMDNQDNIHAAEPGKLLLPGELIQLISLYSQCDPDGRRAIMAAAKGAAEVAPLSTADDKLKLG